MVDDKPIIRAVLYIRVSTEKQEADNQALQLRDYCERKNYEVVEEYVDVISGKEMSRPAYDRLYRHAHKYLFDVVVFWDLSRFSRSGTLFTLQKLKELDNLNIDWESYQEPYFRSAGDFKDVVISIIATVAKIERQKISERTKAGLARAKAQGKQIGRAKGQKDKKDRRKKGYYDNKNRAKSNSKKGVTELFINKSISEELQTKAPFSVPKIPIEKPKELRRYYCVSETCGKSWYGTKDICPTCRRKGRKTPIKKLDGTSKVVNDEM